MSTQMAKYQKFYGHNRSFKLSEVFQYLNTTGLEYHIET